MVSALLLTLALFQAPQESTQPMGTAKPLTDEKVEKCILEGKVTSAVDGAPLKKATVMIFPQQQPGVMTRPLSATSDADGKFLFKEVEPSRYTLNVFRNGYARQNYGARVPNGPGSTIALIPGQHLKDINVRLTPGAAINGRIVDEDNDPVAGVFVTPQRWGYQQGKRQLLPYGGATTDDRGQYRIFGLAPGRYYISATYRGPNAFMPANQDAKETSETYAPTYYPGVYDVGQAAAVDLKAGDDIAGVVFRLAKVHAVSVSGFVRGSDGQPIKSASIQLLPRRGMFSGFDMQMRMTDEKGAFSIGGVMPGAYVLFVRSAMDQQQIFGRADIDVAGNAIDNVVVQTSSGMDIEAEVHVDGPVDLSKTSARLMLTPEEMVMPVPGSATQLKEPGTVVLTKVYDGNYLIRVGPLPDDAYVSKAIFDDKDVLAESLKLRGSGGKLDVTINASGAHIEGSALDKENQPFKGAVVALVPDEAHRSRTDLFRSATTDQYGHFVLRGVPPGTYKLYAWEAIDSGAYMDPEFLKSYEDQGKTVQLGPGERSSPELKVIPSAKTGT
jgi:protocatechuate 3,4-dioxygenase beta subunit